MFRFNKIMQADRGQFVADPFDIHTQSIVIHIELVIPKKIDQIVPRTDLSGVFIEIVQYFKLVFCKVDLLSMKFERTVLQV